MFWYLTKEEVNFVNKNKDIVFLMYYYSSSVMKDTIVTREKVKTFPISGTERRRRTGEYLDCKGTWIIGNESLSCNKMFFVESYKKKGTE